MYILHSMQYAQGQVWPVWAKAQTGTCKGTDTRGAHTRYTYYILVLGTTLSNSSSTALLVARSDHE